MLPSGAELRVGLTNGDADDVEDVNDVIDDVDDDEDEAEEGVEGGRRDGILIKLLSGLHTL